MSTPIHFKLTALSAALLSLTTSTSWAQEEMALIDEVIVIGIRRSLTDAMDIKRDANGVVEAISAEDIGKFPDTNLAESMQRLTGVSIDRSNNEGNEITVRGFGPTFNLVTLNGRQMPTSAALNSEGVNRSFNFKEIAAESVSGVKVYKSNRADLTSGGIGATIDIQTARPFDNDGFTAAASVKGIMDNSNKEGDDITPEASGMISTTFFDDMFGVLVAGSYSERDSQSQRVGSQGWIQGLGSADTSAIDTEQNPARFYWAPNTFEVEVANHYRTRENGQVVLQFAPTDSLTASLDYVMSNYEEDIDMNRTSYWFDNPQSVTDSNGTAIEIRNPGDQLNFWAWDYHFRTENESLGLNIEWDVSDALTLKFDAHDSTSHSQPDGQPAETLTSLNTPIDWYALPPVGLVDIGADLNGTELPSLIYDDSTLLSQTGADAFDKSNVSAGLYQQRGYEVDNNIEQFQLAGTWSIDTENGHRSIEVGVENTLYDVNSYHTADVNNGLQVDISDLEVNFYPRGDFGEHLDGPENLFPELVDYSADELLALIADQDQLIQSPAQHSHIEEDTFAAYIALNIDTFLMQLPVTINAGLRYEDTTVIGNATQAGIDAIQYTNTGALTPVYSDATTTYNQEHSYTHTLPNLDVKIDLSSDWVARVSYSEALARADLSGLFPSINISSARPGGPYYANQGNTQLSPYEAQTFDLSLEWYYASGSYLSAGYFDKKVDNFLTAYQIPTEILDVNGEPLRDPSINPRPGCPDTTNTACLSQPQDPIINWAAITPTNADSTSVNGLELNLQHMFGSSGFGVIANATIVDSDAKYDVNSYSQSIVLPGLSDSANLVGFYENNGLQLRITYNWRDEFLLSTGQHQSGTEPTFTEEYGQVDINASYDINDAITVFIEGLNVGEATIRRHGRYSEQLIDAEEYGSRYSLGIRAKF
ncbi:TonB-dependent receptor [Gilvimarinus agarilyticus]|uniref:TonB-dependent receptor n=1 Tax=Gilvimarinus sp. 2_MG-2023 TaxID=3062666 RepID=UPI001C096A4D|nr:TonB-dependent receptor [Gilvimarinus sp. 2_MG-2023]MBU2886396.1 TonB-dependent receptor [Gilvimarinus agarilyticus]MDO6571075.1 TonB-dependent receptor [Gilvimarinus sp. 2_MG-2023]